MREASRRPLADVRVPYFSSTKTRQPLMKEVSRADGGWEMTEGTWTLDTTLSRAQSGQVRTGLGEPVSEPHQQTTPHHTPHPSSQAGNKAQSVIRRGPATGRKLTGRPGLRESDWCTARRLKDWSQGRPGFERCTKSLGPWGPGATVGGFNPRTVTDSDSDSGVRDGCVHCFCHCSTRPSPREADRLDAIRCAHCTYRPPSSPSHLCPPDPPDPTFSPPNRLQSTLVTDPPAAHPGTLVASSRRVARDQLTPLDAMHPRCR